MQVSHPSGNRQIQQGFSLIEVVLAIGLSVIVIGALYATFLPTVTTWRLANASQRVHETQDRIEDLFHRVRSSSILGCTDQVIPFSTVSLVNPEALWAFNFTEPFRSTPSNNAQPTDINWYQLLYTNLLNADGTKSLATSGETKVGDIVVALSPDSKFYRLNNLNYTGTQQVLTLVNDLGAAVTVNPGELYLVHDCNQTTVIRAEANSYNGALIYTTNNPQGYPIKTVVSGYDPAIYYIGGQVVNGVTIPTLYQRKIQKAGAAVITNDNPLINDVVNMRVVYDLIPTSTFVPPTLALNQVCCTTKQLLVDPDVPAKINRDVARATLLILFKTPIRNDSNNPQLFNFMGDDGITYRCDTLIDDANSMMNSSNACPSFLTDEFQYRQMSLVFDLPKPR